MSSTSAVNLRTFKKRHLSSLEMDQPKFNLMLGLLARAEHAPDKIRLWSFGNGTRCALQTPPHFIVLGDMNDDDVTQLAAEVKGDEFIGCLGAEEMPDRFAKQLARHGIRLQIGMSQTIMVLHQLPIYPGIEGAGRLLEEKDVPTFIEWMVGFHHDAELPEPLPSKEKIAQIAFEQPVYVWEVKSKIVSMAAKNRETKDGGNVSLVYTPPELRGRGYAGSVTAYTAEQIFSSGKRIAFLYVDARNTISNRVYEKIGFRTHCAATTYVREKK